jgi:hypothetical protein
MIRDLKQLQFFFALNPNKCVGVGDIKVQLFTECRYGKIVYIFLPMQ